ncbi:MAG: hypothetical protein EON47_21755 [Acetobacteraceae bacterium]|nr:MAG: hypothetical protein EON47_21755 [Acetobacteraceae bacterium]
MIALALGQIVYLDGDVTQNRWVGARSARALEASLGYGTGRLSAGWWVAVLQDGLEPDDFEFGGITLRSGGRLGLPATSWEADEKRSRVHDEVLARLGPEGYERARRNALTSITPKGENRIVKVLPVTKHSPDISPDRQYPMGGGGLQWRLRRRCKFLIALAVDANGVATIPNGSFFLGESAAYDDRAKIARYLDSV